MHISRPAHWLVNNFPVNPSRSAHRREFPNDGAGQHTGLDMSPHNMKAFYRRVDVTASIHGASSSSVREFAGLTSAQSPDLDGKWGAR